MTSRGRSRVDTERDESASASTAVESFDEFYREQFVSVLALARVLTGDGPHAEDITHDAFAAALEKWTAIDSPSAWIRTVIVNKSRSAWRRHYSEKRALEAMRATIRVGHDLPADTEHFWAEVRRLPRRQAQVLALFYLEDRPVEEVAQILQCSASTARVHLTRGRRSLARRLGVDHE